MQREKEKVVPFNYIRKEAYFRPCPFRICGMIVEMVREIRIYGYEAEEDLPEIRAAVEHALLEHAPLLRHEIGFDFDHKQISLLLDFDTMPDALGFAASKEVIAIEALLNRAVLIHRYWREHDA